MQPHSLTDLQPSLFFFAICWCSRLPRLSVELFSSMVRQHGKRLMEVTSCFPPLRTALVDIEGDPGLPTASSSTSKTSALFHSRSSFRLQLPARWYRTYLSRQSGISYSLGSVLPIPPSSTSVASTRKACMELILRRPPAKTKTEAMLLSPCQP